MADHTCLAPGREWTACLCAEIDPADVPCIVCTGREALEAQCPACIEAKSPRVGAQIIDLGEALKRRMEKR